MSSKIQAKRTGRLVTFTRAIRGVERRTLTVDLWAPPENQYEMQQWFIGLLGRIWWDVTDTESFVITTMDADKMVSYIQAFRDEVAAGDAA